MLKVCKQIALCTNPIVTVLNSHPKWRDEAHNNIIMNLRYIKYTGGGGEISCILNNHLLNHQNVNIVARFT